MESSRRTPAAPSFSVFFSLPYYVYRRDGSKYYYIVLFTNTHDVYFRTFTARARAARLYSRGGGFMCTPIVYHTRKS